MKSLYNKYSLTWGDRNTPFKISSNARTQNQSRTVTANVTVYWGSQNSSLMWSFTKPGGGLRETNEDNAVPPRLAAKRRTLLPWA